MSSTTSSKQHGATLKDAGAQKTQMVMKRKSRIQRRLGHVQKKCADAAKDVLAVHMGAEKLQGMMSQVRAVTENPDF
eukprot:3500242-Karenia_brevis.AAC.1